MFSTREGDREKKTKQFTVFQKINNPKNSTTRTSRNNLKKTIYSEENKYITETEIFDSDWLKIYLFFPHENHVYSSLSLISWLLQSQTSRNNRVYESFSDPLEKYS